SGVAEMLDSGVAEGSISGRAPHASSGGARSTIIVRRAVDVLTGVAMGPGAGVGVAPSSMMSLYGPTPQALPSFVFAPVTLNVTAAFSTVKSPRMPPDTYGRSR